MSRTITLEEFERKELIELYRTAQTTPAIKLSMNSRSWADMAWDRVRDYMNELGEKHGYDPSIHMVNPETGEVVIHDISEETKNE